MDEAKEQILRIIDGMVHFKWHAIATAWLVAIIGWIVVMKIPDVYKSQSTVYVDTQTLLKPLLSGLAPQQNSDQIGYIVQTLLSRTNVEGVVKALSLIDENSSPEKMEQVVQNLTKSIVIQGDSRGIYQISYENSNPETAYKVVDSFLTLFIENNLGESRSDTQETRDFIDQQLKLYETDLKKAEIKLSEFKIKNSSYLSSNGNYALKFDQLSTALKNLKEDIESLINQKTTLSENLSEIPRYIDSNMANNKNGKTQGTLQSLEERIHQQESNLDALKLRFTEEHPEVKAQEKALLALKHDYRDTLDKLQNGVQDENIVVAQVPNPAFEEAQNKILEYDNQIDLKTKEINRINDELEDLKKIGDIAPEIDSEYAELTRNAEILRANYQGFLQRSASLKITQASESETAAKFRIIDQPKLPALPSGPPRHLFIITVLILSLGSGAGVAFVLSQLQDSFFSLSQLKEEYGDYVLGSVTILKDPMTLIQERKMIAYFITSLGGLIGLSLILFMLNLRTLLK